MAKAFASQEDMSEKPISFTEIGEGLYAFTAEGDPNSGVIIDDDSVMIIEAQATPRLPQKVINCVRGVTDKPIIMRCGCWEPRLLAPTKSSWGTPPAPWWSSVDKKIGTANFNAFRAYLKAVKASPA